MDRAWEAEGVYNEDKAILLVVYLYIGQLFLMVIRMFKTYVKNQPLEHFGYL